MPTTHFGVSDASADEPKSQEYLDFVAQMHPLGRSITAEDCAEAALYLASDLAKNVTGIALPIDGGLVAR
jgi:enoyl-[acyl-carrier-protein] reductase (NADH)